MRNIRDTGHIEMKKMVIQLSHQGLSKEIFLEKIAVIKMAITVIFCSEKHLHGR